jgi:hypothetical protein
MTYGHLSLVDLDVVANSLPQICTASFVGPVLNISVNLIVLEGMLDAKGLSYSVEFLSQALGHLFAFMGFGFNSYISVADTSIMRKAGGTSARAVILMCAMLFSVCLIPSVMPVLAITIPVLLPASLFVYIGIDIVLGCLGEMRGALSPMEYSFSLLTCCFCVVNSLPVGLVMACVVCAFQRLTLTLPSFRQSDGLELKPPTALSNSSGLGEKSVAQSISCDIAMGA